MDSLPESLQALIFAQLPQSTQSAVLDALQEPSSDDGDALPALLFDLNNADALKESLFDESVVEKLNTQLYWHTDDSVDVCALLGIDWNDCALVLLCLWYRYS